ncbi:MAG: hypothetical protein ACLVKI_05630 [Gordonibacter urolithinfaciens]
MALLGGAGARVPPLTVGDDEVQPAAEKLAGDLAKLGLKWSSTTV